MQQTRLIRMSVKQGISINEDIVVEINYLKQMCQGHG